MAFPSFIDPVKVNEGIAVLAAKSGVNPLPKIEKSPEVKVAQNGDTTLIIPGMLGKDIKFTAYNNDGSGVMTTSAGQAVFPAGSPHAAAVLAAGQSINTAAANADQLQAMGYDLMTAAKAFGLTVSRPRLQLS